MQLKFFFVNILYNFASSKNVKNENLFILLNKHKNKNNNISAYMLVFTPSKTIWHYNFNLLKEIRETQLIKAPQNAGNNLAKTLQNFILKFSFIILFAAYWENKNVEVLLT